MRLIMVLVVMVGMVEAPKGLGGFLGAGDGPIAEVHDRLIQGATATTDDQHALWRNRQAVVPHGGAGLDGHALELKD